MAENKSFLNEEYTQLITEIRNHLWVACTKYNNEMPSELKEFLDSYKLDGSPTQCSIHDNIYHALDHMNKLLSKLRISQYSIDTDDINLDTERNNDQENKLWLLTFALDNGARWHEYNAVIKGPDEDYVKRRLLEISSSLVNDSYIPHDAIKVQCINEDDYICFTTIPHSEFKNNGEDKK